MEKPFFTEENGKCYEYCDPESNSLLIIMTSFQMNKNL